MYVTIILGHWCIKVSLLADEVGPDAIQFDENMTAEELCELLKSKGVDDEDCALFRSKVYTLW